MEPHIELSDWDSKPKLLKLCEENGSGDDFLEACAREFSNEYRIALSESKENPRVLRDQLLPFHELKRLLDASFFPEQVQDELQSALQRLQSTAVALYTGDAESPCFLFSENTILPYLDCYHSLLYCLLLHYEDIKQWPNGQGFLRRILGLGCLFDSEASSRGISFCYKQIVPNRKGEIGTMTPLAPCYLSALLEVAWEKQSCQALQEGLAPPQAVIYREILQAYMRRYMNWYLFPPEKAGNSICRIRLRMYTEIQGEKEKLSLPILPVEKTSSYEGISELRLFEKIQYELEHVPPAGKDDPFQIYLIGEIDLEMFLRLCGMLEDFAASTNQYLKLVVITKESDDMEDSQQSTHISYGWRGRDVYRQIFSDSRTLVEQVAKADLIFFLDGCELYEPLRPVAYAGLNSFLQQAPPDSYPRRKNSMTLLRPGNSLFSMFSLLTGAACGDGTPALLKKVARRQMVDYLEHELSSGSGFRNGSASVYVYYSDLEAAGDLYWKEDHFLRVEQYACKEIAILRFGRKDDEPLAIRQGDHVIVFNLWQFVKHTILHRLRYLMEYFIWEESGGTSSFIQRLSRTFVGIDYSDWRNSLRFYYWLQDKENCPDAQFEKQAIAYIRDAVIPCFTAPEDNIYAQYLRKCYGAFLYSDAKSVDDMLFLHLFEKEPRQFRASLPPEERELKPFLCTKKKYSGKRFYQEIMSDYDSPSQFFANQYRKLEIMEEDGKLSSREVFMKVGQACEKNGYMDSYLYRNCLKQLT